MEFETNASAKGPEDLPISPGPDQVNQQLQRILADPEFKATKAQRAFLTYVVKKVLSGKSEDIKGYSIATEVFGRPEDFDQATDPIVSMHANKLRRALEHYYLVNGMQDPIRIGIPKGTYVPIFRHQPGPVQPDSIHPHTPEEPSICNWPVIIVLPFENLSNDSDLAPLTLGLQTELVLEMTRFRDFRVLRYSKGAYGRRITDSGVRFLLDGTIRRDQTGIKVTVSLTDARNNVRIWNDVYQADHEAAQLFTFQEHIAQTVVSHIAGECGVIAKTISHESKKILPAELTTYQAFLRYYEFEQNFTQDSFTNAFKALNIALKREPDCGRVWSLLARLHAINSTLELFRVDTSLENALRFAQNGIRLEPDSMQTRLIMGFVYLLNGALNAGHREAWKAAELNPNAVYYMENIGYVLSLCGNWDHGLAMIRRAVQLNPFYNVNIHHIFWVDHARQNDYPQALLESYNFRSPALFWDHLLRAAALGLTNTTEEGKTAAAHLLALKPDFCESGRRLISYYIKFDDIIETILDGLNRVGVIVR